MVPVLAKTVSPVWRVASSIVVRVITAMATACVRTSFAAVLQALGASTVALELAQRASYSPTPHAPATASAVGPASARASSVGAGRGAVSSIAKMDATTVASVMPVPSLVIAKLVSQANRVSSSTATHWTVAATGRATRTNLRASAKWDGVGALAT